ncbi:uncharacterized protein LOC122507091 [Leptopilina heterotoma]|uniref:uncharacterized protein LOC122507091 n=1 Tax=Leptopilina heterotoma TaxID=63436 RepID=UPI001CA9B14F|nr:uncharacterized protein LOC122507091 [Leptopilina heterotoma]
MHFVFLPFLFAWNPSPYENIKYGPEYTFYMEINMIAAMNTDNGATLGTRVSGELKCRPNDTNLLICRTEDTKIIRTHPNGFNTSGIEIPRNESYSPYGLGHDLFQVKFNNEGIESYSLESANDEASKWIIDMIRFITNQLSIGFVLDDRRNDEQFKKLENFTVGECETEFKISRRKDVNNNSNNNNNNKGPKIIPIFDQTKFIFGPFDEIEIEKRRNIQNCPRHKEYFFGTRYIKGIVLKDVYNKLMSSTSRIKFSTFDFVSETTNECEIFDMDKNRIGKVLDHIKLKLTNIQSAREEMVFISNATAYDTLAGDSVNNYKN